MLAPAPPNAATSQHSGTVAVHGLAQVHSEPPHTLHPNCVCRKLLHRNPDNQRHHAALLEALQLDTGKAEQLDRVAALYDDLGRQFPRSMAVRRLPLDFKVGSSLGV